MPILKLRFPEVEDTPNNRPRHCPYCGSPILQRWGRVSKSVHDLEHQETEVQRYRCGECERTFRDYPEGIDRSSQSLRIRHLAALAWAMGLSCRDVVSVFDELGVRLSRMSVWRDGQELAARLGGQGGPRRARRFSIERLASHQKPNRPGVVIVIDPGDGRTVVLGVLDEFDPRKVKSWLEPLVAEVDIEVSLLETDYLLEPEMGWLESLQATAN